MDNISIIKRVFNLFKTNLKHFTSSTSIENIKKWRKLKGRFVGKRVFLIANGPSLNITPLYLLKNEYTIAFNRFQLMLERLNYHPTFYMIADGVVASNIREEIQYYIKNCEYVFTPDIKKGDLVDFTQFIPYKKNVYWVYEEPIRFSHHLPFVNHGSTVIYIAFQVLKYLGFSEVVVVGNDMNYVIHKTAEVVKETQTNGHLSQSIRSTEDDDPNHYDPRYFGKGKEYHQPTEEFLRMMLDNLDVVAREYKKHGVKIVNAGYNSMVKSFPKRNFYDVLAYSQEEIDRLFDELVINKGIKSKEWLFENAIPKEEDWNGDFDVVSVPMEKAMVIVKKKILDYLPLGPYKDVVYFVKRNIIKKNCP